MSVKTTT